MALEDMGEKIRETAVWRRRRGKRALKCGMYCTHAASWRSRRPVPPRSMDTTERLRKSAQTGKAQNDDGCEISQGSCVPPVRARRPTWRAYVSSLLGRDSTRLRFKKEVVVSRLSTPCDLRLPHHATVITCPAYTMGRTSHGCGRARTGTLSNTCKVLPPR